MAGRRGRVPLILQMEAAECGAACLGMILASFGRWVPLEELRERCNASRNGVSAADMVEAAATYGLKARGYSCEIDELDNKPLPQVLFWNFDHFVVLESRSGGQFHIVDPAFGRRSVGAAEFERRFTGVTLTFEREASFVRSPRLPGVWDYLLRQAGQSVGTLAFILLVSVLAGLLAVLIPSFTQIFLDEYLGQERHTWLLPLIGAMIAVSVLRTVLAWFQVEAVRVLTAKLTLEQSATFIWRLMHLPLSFFVRRSAGELSTRAQMGGVAGAVAGPLVQAGINVLYIVMFATAMALYSLPLAALCILLAAGGLLVLWGLERLMHEGSLRVEMLGGSAHAVGIQSMALVEDYKATGTEALLFERMMEAELRHVEAEQRMGGLRALTTSFPALFNGLMVVLVLGVGSLQVFDGAMTIGALVAFYLLSGQFAGSVGSLFGATLALQATSGAVVRIRDTMDTPPDPIFARQAANDEGAAIERLEGTVAAHGLRYAYAHGPLVIDGVDLELAPGEFVALVGSSGCGKTTLGRLLVGQMKADDGELRFGGRLLDDIPEPTFRGSIGYVDQMPYFFSGRIRDNLTLWDHTVDTASVVKAARDSAAEPMIAGRPGIFEGRVGESGSGFSGGERQMLAMARALVHEPSFLVLDEATSALDALSEEHVLLGLRRRGATCLLISHRMSAIRYCSRVLVMDRGRIVAAGPPATVLSGKFAHLVEGIS